MDFNSAILSAKENKASGQFGPKAQTADKQKKYEFNNRIFTLRDYHTVPLSINILIT